MSKKRVQGISISLRKNEIYERRANCKSFSSLEEAHRIITETDPDLLETVSRNVRYHLGNPVRHHVKNPKK